MAYLINISGNQDVVIKITGVASVKKTTWVPDSFNLMGFKVNPDTPPDFETFFSASPAHAGQAVYELNKTTGKWNFIENLAATKIKSGEAYWIYCEGASTYQGPLEVILPSLKGLDYGKYSDTLALTFHNITDNSLMVNILPLSAEIELVYKIYNAETGVWEWPPLNSMPPFSMTSGIWKNVRISVRKESLGAEKAESLIRIWDDLGTQLIVPVFVEKEIVQ
jgi:hypothetical protein